MQKITYTFIATSLSSATIAQDTFGPQNAHLNMEVFNICATIVVFILVMVFALAILKRILEYRLRNKIADKGISENIASSILQTATKDDGSANIQWFLILACLGVGLTIINYTLPLGIHSLAIMSFSIAVSFLGHHIFLKRSGK
jgi:heme/copper-type cytochrome/quinol oxidase subunit 2